MSRPKRAWRRHDRNEFGATRYGAVHEKNPAGSKWLRRWYKRKNARRATFEKALAWNADRR